MRYPGKFVTVKIRREVFNLLRRLRRESGVPISTILRDAVNAWMHQPLMPRLRRRATKRGSR